MAFGSNKRSYPLEEDLHDFDAHHCRDDEKTIPFLRRLTDMLTENKDVISFVPGNHANGRTVLGRIVVHDRIQVEADVLPRYFNHASFASLRRQLNYFSFVRLGKGRQRESTYINEHVVELEDILHLKRRSTTGGNPDESKERLIADLTSGEKEVVGTKGLPVLDLSVHMDATKKVVHRSKRQKQTRKPRPTTISPRSESPVENNCISEDEHADEKHFIALDLTKPENKAADKEVLECCKDLLMLASRRWD